MGWILLRPTPPGSLDDVCYQAMKEKQSPPERRVLWRALGLEVWRLMCGLLEEVLGLFGELLERSAAVPLPQQLLQVGVSPPALQRESDSK